jgi:hypothetical protein
MYMVIDRRNFLKSAKPTEEANDRYVNGDRSLSRCVTLGVRVLQRMDSQPYMSTIDRTWARESRDLLIGHFPSFHHHFSPLSLALHLGAFTPPLHLHIQHHTTFLPTTNHHSRSFAGHYTPPQATTFQPPCPIVAQNPHLPVLFNCLLPNHHKFFF